VLPITKSNKSWPSLEQDPITKNGCTKLLLLNLVAFAWFLMSWLDHKCMNETLGALNALGYVWSVLILEGAEWEPLRALIYVTSRIEPLEKKLSEKVLTPVNPVLPPRYRRFDWWVYFLSFWTSHWRSTDDIFEVHRFNRWTQLVRVQEKYFLMEWTDGFSFITGLTGEHILSHPVSGNAPVYCLPEISVYLGSTSYHTLSMGMHWCSVFQNCRFNWWV
jgi:hypothetical protein